MPLRLDDRPAPKPPSSNLPLQPCIAAVLLRLRLPHESLRCDVRLGKPGGPQTLFALKRYLPCANRSCNKVGADGLACEPHRTQEERAMLPRPPKVKSCQLESPPDGFL